MSFGAYSIAMFMWSSRNFEVPSESCGVPSARYVLGGGYRTLHCNGPPLPTCHEGGEVRIATLYPSCGESPVTQRSGCSVT